MILSMSEISGLTGLSRSVVHSWVSRSIIPSRVILNRPSKIRTFSVDGFLVMALAKFLRETLHVKGPALRKIVREATKEFKEGKETVLLVACEDCNSTPFVGVNAQPKTVKLGTLYVWNLTKLAELLQEMINNDKPETLPPPPIVVEKKKGQ